MAFNAMLSVQNGIKAGTACGEAPLKPPYTPAGFAR